MKPADHRLRYELDLFASDIDWAELISEALTERERLPYRYWINHDVRAASCAKGGPRTGRCPVVYDWANRELVGISTSIKIEAQMWIKRALLAGYDVGFADANYKPIDVRYSLAGARTRAIAARMPPDDDDSIPF